MVEGIVGLPGAGKTYYLSKIGLDAMKKGRKVYANYKLKGAIYFWEIEELQEIEDGVILIDEINLVASSRDWEELPGEQKYFWSQTRKQKLDIYWTAQHQDRVEKIVREVSNFIWKINILPFGIRVMTKYLPEQINKTKRERFGTRIFTIHKEVFKQYNTWERLKPVSYIAKKPYYGRKKHKWSKKYYPNKQPSIPSGYLEQESLKL